MTELENMKGQYKELRTQYREMIKTLIENVSKKKFVRGEIRRLELERKEENRRRRENANKE